MTQLPSIRTVRMEDPLRWLALAWKDISQCHVVSLLHGLLCSMFGGFLMLIGADNFWFLVGAMSGFMGVAPVIATSLYALSRAIERGEKADLDLVFNTWTSWQTARYSDPSSYWALVRFGVLLSVATTVWVLTSAALITLCSAYAIQTPLDFLKYVVAAKNGHLFEIWLSLGALLSAPIFASTVIAMPLLLDCRVNINQAVLTSWQVVIQNPIPMAFWSFLIMAFVLLGLMSMLIGLIFIIPMLGHASWHAYRELVDVSTLSRRD